MMITCFGVFEIDFSIYFDLFDIKTFEIYLHAEISALVKCKSESDTIVVVRLGGHSGEELRNAKPCPICSLALKDAGIEHIYNSTDDGFVYQYK